jgi:LPPG:FO 2-phospho-L-lactate transferase
MTEALAESRAPVVAVSPFVGGKAVKGPTDAFMQQAGHELSAEGIAAAYEGVIDGLVADEPAASLPTLVTDTLMADAAARRRLAQQTLDHAASLSR